MATISADHRKTLHNFILIMSWPAERCTYFRHFSRWVNHFIFTRMQRRKWKNTDINDLLLLLLCIVAYSLWRYTRAINTLAVAVWCVAVTYIKWYAWMTKANASSRSTIIMSGLRPKYGHSWKRLSIHLFTLPIPPPTTSAQTSMIPFIYWF